MEKIHTIKINNIEFDVKTILAIEDTSDSFKKSFTIFININGFNNHLLYCQQSYILTINNLMGVPVYTMCISPHQILELIVTNPSDELFDYIINNKIKKFQLHNYLENNISNAKYILSYTNILNFSDINNSIIDVSDIVIEYEFGCPNIFIIEEDNVKFKDIYITTFLPSKLIDTYMLKIYNKLLNSTNNYYLIISMDDFNTNFILDLNNGMYKYPGKFIINSVFSITDKESLDILQFNKRMVCEF